MRVLLTICLLTKMALPSFGQLTFAQKYNAITARKSFLYVDLKDTLRKTIYAYPVGECIKATPYNGHWSTVSRYGQVYFIKNKNIHKIKMLSY